MSQECIATRVFETLKPCILETLAYTLDAASPAVFT
jgi:hypothetical protein